MVKPAPLSRRTTPHVVTKVTTTCSSGRASRARERDGEEDERVRDNGESFPQFWWVQFAFFFLAYLEDGSLRG